MPSESIEWLFLAASPFLAVVVAYWLCKAASGSRDGSAPASEDHWRNLDYLSWREWTRAEGGPRPIFQMPIFGLKNPCYALESCVSLYEPRTPSLQCGANGDPVFDSPPGMPVGEGWSLKDAFVGMRRVGRGTLCVTSREICFRGAPKSMSIPIRRLRIVAAACSSILLGSGPSERVLLFADVNGQKLRDIISYLLEE